MIFVIPQETALRGLLFVWLFVFFLDFSSGKDDTIFCHF